MIATQAAPGHAAAVTPASPVLELHEVSRSYGRGPTAVTALREVSVALAPASLTAIMGPSGSGKSTLLQCATGLDRPTSGRVRLGDVELTRLREPRLTRARRERVGFVFQDYNLVDSLSVLQNVVLPARLAGRRADRRLARRVLHQVGLGDVAGRLPAQLSGGMRQRVAIARALVQRPDLIVADEPTGALDLATGRAVLSLLRSAVDEQGRTTLMVTHDPAAAATADRVLFLADGRLVGELVSPTPPAVAQRLAELES